MEFDTLTTAPYSSPSDFHRIIWFVVRDLPTDIIPLGCATVFAKSNILACEPQILFFLLFSLGY